MFDDAMEELVRRLTDMERENWSNLDKKINSKQLELLLIKLEKLEYIRKICEEKGLIAKNLNDLKSKNGKSFIKIKSHSKYKRAISATGATLERAYCCWNNFKQRNMCGWVKGRPKKEKCDYLKNMLGEIYRCRICDRILEEKVL